MIISFAGAIGSGKSTIAKMLATKLGWPHYDMGKVWREVAKQRGLSLVELQKISETDATVDHDVDQRLVAMGEAKNNSIIESRTAWHFIPQSLKIYLDVSEEEGARRIFSELQTDQQRNEDKKIRTYEDTLVSVKNRKFCDIKRYQQYYNINPYDQNNYNYALDTTNLNIDEVFTKIFEYVKTHLEYIVDKK